MTANILKTHDTVNATNVCWEITSRCNDRCAFCYRPDTRQELPDGEADLVLDRLIEGGVRKITWTGGEALLCKNTERLIQRAHAAGVVTSLITNAILLTPERAECLAPHLDWITFSLDGPDGETQRAMTRNAGHFERITGWLGWFQAEFPGVRRKINTVAASPNLEAVPAIADIVRAFDVCRWKIFRFFPVRGTAARNSADFSVSDADFRRLASRMDAVRAALPGCRVDVEDHEQMNDAYLSVLPDGELRVSHDNGDTLLGSLVSGSFQNLVRCPAFSPAKHGRRTSWLYKPAEAVS